MKIYTSNNDYCFNVILEDTPNPQIIFLPCESEDTIIEILSVYKGLRYDDTCIECRKILLSGEFDKAIYKSLEYTIAHFFMVSNLTLIWWRKM